MHLPASLRLLLSEYDPHLRCEKNDDTYLSLRRYCLRPFDSHPLADEARRVSVSQAVRLAPTGRLTGQ